MSEPAQPAPATSYREAIPAAAALFEKGDYDGAAALFQQIGCSTELTAPERAFMFLNVATVREKQGQTDAALWAFDEALVQALQTWAYVQQSRAQYLIRIGRPKESIPLMEELLRSNVLGDEFRQSCETHLNLAREQAGIARPSIPKKVAASPDSPAAARFSEAPRAAL